MRPLGGWWRVDMRGSAGLLNLIVVAVCSGRRVDRRDRREIRTRAAFVASARLVARSQRIVRYRQEPDGTVGVRNPRKHWGNGPERYLSVWA